MRYIKLKAINMVHCKKQFLMSELGKISGHGYKIKVKLRVLTFITHKVVSTCIALTESVIKAGLMTAITYQDGHMNCLGIEGYGPSIGSWDVYEGCPLISVDKLGCIILTSKVATLDKLGLAERSHCFLATLISKLHIVRRSLGLS